MEMTTQEDLAFTAMHQARDAYCIAIEEWIANLPVFGESHECVTWDWVDGRNVEKPITRNHHDDEHFLALLEFGHERQWVFVYASPSPSEDWIGGWVAHCDGADDYTDEGFGSYYVTCTSCGKYFQSPKNGDGDGDWEWD